jgi:hypothetical protein
MSLRFASAMAADNDLDYDYESPLCGDVRTCVQCKEASSLHQKARDGLSVVLSWSSRTKALIFILLARLRTGRLDFDRGEITADTEDDGEITT